MDENEKTTKPFPPTVLIKAEDLVRSEAVTRLSDTTYSVESQHPEALHVQPHYMVQKRTDGIWKCSCKGFEKRKICSHVIAVMMTEARRKAGREN